MDNQRPAKRRQRERTLRHATLLGLTATFGVALLLYVFFFYRNPSDLQNYYEVVKTPNSGISPNSQLIADFQHTIDRLELIVTPIALFFGGLVLGKLAPRIVGKRRVVLTAAKMGFFTLITVVAFPWILKIILEHQTKVPMTGQVDAILIAVQAGEIIVWTLACALGGLVGSGWRDRRRTRQQTGTPVTP